MAAVVLNAGPGAWAFEEAARRLSALFGVPVSEAPGDWNYVLAWEGDAAPAGKCFVPWEAIRTAGDKRRLAQVYAAAGAATPETHLEASEEAVRRRLAAGARRWVLKWPTGCGGSGHRLLEPGFVLPREWPQPYLVQEFVEMPRPEVYRLYCVAGESFGWNVRRFPREVEASPWVAHARGAVYEAAGPVPDEARGAAERALRAAGLWESFGCADLLPSGRGWLVLEVNTDGPYNVVDRDIPLPGVLEELEWRLAAAFHRWTEGDLGVGCG